MKQPTSIECIGHTPLIAIPHLCEEEGARASVLVKLEKNNPFGSVKDRAALYIIRELEQAGRLAPGGCIVEPTSGNTGVGLAAIGACRGYRVVLTMPASMSQERRMLLAALGAELVLTPAEAGMQGAIDKADALVKAIPGAVLAGQFVNPANVKAVSYTHLDVYKRQFLSLADALFRHFADEKGCCVIGTAALHAA